MGAFCALCGASGHLSARCPWINNPRAMMKPARYQCPACGTLTNTVRCPSCGTDTEERIAPEQDLPAVYSIFDHAQKGHISNALVLAHARADTRRFTGRPLTGFGAL